MSASEPDRRRASCKLCIHGCAVIAHVENGTVVRVTGDRDDPLYRGYCCVKGRGLPAFINHPRRLLRPLKRTADGFRELPSAWALDEIAVALQRIVKEHGARSVACYAGTQVMTGTAALPFLNALMDAIGSPMRFTPNTIDKPGKDIAGALHGRWMAPSIGFDDPNVLLMVGINPLITYTGLPHGNPVKWMSARLEAGADLIVIDPRRSDLARRATLFLQARPGTDAALLAAMLRVVIDEGRIDDEFVRANVDGLDPLRAGLAPFVPSEVARLADVAEEDLVRAARVWASRGRGYAFAGTGPNMSGGGPLIAYLLLALQSLCGYWLREADRVRTPGTIIPARQAKAQAAPPRPATGFGEHLRIRGLTDTAAGLPTAALVDEILTPGDGQVRALLCISGNPAVAFPDQAKTAEALRRLDLLVQIDPWMSETAKLAKYVLPPRMCLEIPTSNWSQDQASGMNGYGTNEPYARYLPAVVEPPPRSDLMEEWQMISGIANRMGFPLQVKLATTAGFTSGSAVLTVGPETSMTSDDILEFLSTGSRIPFEELRSNPGGQIYSDHDVRVLPKEVGWTGRLDVGSAEMLADLEAVGRGHVPTPSPVHDDDELPFRLLCRRLAYVYNSSFHDEVTHRGRGFNPAFMHPDDLETLHLVPGDTVVISNHVGSLRAVVEVDRDLRRGMVSMSFGFGGLPGQDDDFLERGVSTSRLVSDAVNFDRYTGQPRMSNVPVRVDRLVATE